MAAEIVRKVLDDSFLAVGREILQQLGEETRLGLAEAVNALLDVADHEAV